MKKLLLIGTFDCLHAGHINLFYEASKIGEVYVGVTADHLNISNPDKDDLIFDQNERKSLIEPLNFVKEVLIIDPKFDESKLDNIIKDNNITAIAHGSDYEGDTSKETIAKRNNIENIILPRTKNISSSQIRKMKYH